MGDLFRSGVKVDPEGEVGKEIGQAFSSYLRRSTRRSRERHHKFFGRRYGDVISVLLPSRQRPELLKQLHDSALETADHRMDFEVVACLDDDDDSYPEDLLASLANLSVLRTARTILSKYWNICWENSTGAIGMLCADDVVFRTKGWDTRVREEFEKLPNRIGCVFGDDTVQHEKLCTLPFIHRNWVDAVGYFVPEYFSSGYNDVWIMELAQAIDRYVYMPDVVFEHLDPGSGKREADLVYHEHAAKGQADRVTDIYMSKAPERGAAIEKLRVAMTGEGA